MIYIDTSCLIKVLLPEPDSPEVQALVAAEDAVIISSLAELEAESVAYIVCDDLDIQADEWTVGYIASWSGGGDEAIDAIKAAATRIQRTADRILSALQIEGDSGEEPVSNDVL